MKKLLIIAMACYGLSARAQLHESRNFLYLYSDSIVYANDIKFRPDFSGNLRVRVDSRNVPIGQVKFLNSKDGFFANTRKLVGLNTELFAERIIEGRINVFQERSLSHAPFIYNSNHVYETNYLSAPSLSISSNMYYNRGYADLKKLNYSNLKRELADNPKSMDMLSAYRRSRNTTTLLYVAGAAAFVTGVAVLSSGGENAYSDTKFIMGFSLSALGAGLFSWGYLKPSSARQKFEAAVDIYNR